MAQILVTLTGPSGIGKGYLKKYLKKVFNFKEPVVYTTREKRKDEDFSERMFLTKREFLEKVKNKELILVRKIYGNYYGFHKNAFLINSNLITEIHIDNVEKFKKMYPHALMLGFLSKTLDFLIYRLKKKEKESGQKVTLRLDEIKKEIKKIQKKRKLFNQLFYVDRDNEGKICKEVENYIKNFYNLKNA